MAVVWLTPSDVTPSGTSGWQDVDSSDVPDGASGVIVQYENTNVSNTDHDMGFRKNGSTDDRHGANHEESHQYALIGVDGSGVFEAYRDTTDVKYYLIGYTQAESVFATNGSDETPSTRDVFTDVDISGSTGGDTSIAGVFEFADSNANADMNGRKNGSTDGSLPKYRRHNWNVVGVDGSEICEWNIETDSGFANLIFLVGYHTTEATLHTNATDRTSDLSAQSYADLAALPSGATGGIYRFEDFADDGADEYYGIRENGSSRDIKRCSNTEFALAIAKADGSRVVEAFAETITGNFCFEAGYFEEAAAVAVIPSLIMPPIQPPGLRA